MNGLLESFSRCFHPTNAQDGSTTQFDTSKRMQNVDLQDPEWDKLFDEDHRKQQQQSSSKKRDFEMSYGDVVQKAREAASSTRSHNNMPRKSRKSDIFRAREEYVEVRREDKADTKSGAGIGSFFKENAQYLCFANPIGEAMCGVGQSTTSDNKKAHNTSIDPAVPIAPKLSDEDCDDGTSTVHTETSTQYFDRKHGISRSKGQPMPLFSEFRIECLDWSANDEAADCSDENAQYMRKKKGQQRLFDEFEMKVKESPSRKEQIENVFAPSKGGDPYMMPDVLPLSGSQSTLGSRSRSSSSRSSQRKSIFLTPQRTNSGRKQRSSSSRSAMKSI